MLLFLILVVIIHLCTKWLSEEALQIAVKQREVKGKEKRKDILI